MAKPSVSIIGAGVIGLFTAWRFAKAGWDVTVYERDTGLGATSLAAAGVLSPFDNLQQRPKQRMQRQSLWLYPDLIPVLESDAGLSVDFIVCGRIRLIEPKYADKISEAARQSDAWPRPQPAQTYVKGEGGHPLVKLADYAGHLRCYVTATLDPAKALTALKKATEAYGGTFCFGEELDQHAVYALGTDYTINTCGAWAGQLLPEVTLAPTKKEGITLELPKGLDLPLIVENKDTYIVPRLGGGTHFYVGSLKGEGTDLTPSPNSADILYQEAIQLVPALVGAKVVAHHVGLQPKTPRGRAMYLGQNPLNPRHFIATGHGGVGFGMAPLTAQVLLDIAQGQTPSFDIRSFAI